MKDNGSFSITQDGITFEILWEAKCFSIKCTINGIKLLDFHQMMFMCPLTYTEKAVRRECRKMIPNFIEAVKIITENKVFFDEKIEFLKKLKSEHKKRIEEVSSSKKVLKEQFQNKTITQTEYQKQQGKLEEYKIEYSRKAIAFMRDAAKEITISDTRCMHLIFYFFNEIWRDRS